MKKQRSTSRTFYLKTRELFGYDPLPEEQLGLVGADAYSVDDYIKTPKEGELNPINLVNEFFVGQDGMTIRDQGRTNRCTGFAGAALLEVMHAKLNKLSGNAASPVSCYSANQIYWFTRRDKRYDHGGFMRHLMRALACQGGCSAVVWADHLSPLNFVDDTALASKFKIDGYERIVLGRDSSVLDVKRVLSVEKLPIAIGAMLYDKSCRDALNTGIFELPKPGDRKIGGHAMLIVGWTDIGGRTYLILVNSWGRRVGKRGYFLIPIEALIEGTIMDAWSPVETTY